MEENRPEDSTSKFHKSFRSRNHRSYKMPRFLAVVEEAQKLNRRRTVQEGATTTANTTTGGAPGSPFVTTLSANNVIKEGTLTVQTRSHRRLSGHSQLSLQTGTSCPERNLGTTSALLFIRFIS